MKVVSKEPRPLDRLTLEGTMISEHRSGLLLNRKGEWGQNLPLQFGILGTEEEEGSRLRPKRVRKKKRSRQEDEVEKTPSKRDRRDQDPPDLGMTVQQPGQNEEQITIEKPQTHSVISYFLANQSKHELGLQNGFQGGKATQDHRKTGHKMQ